MTLEEYKALEEKWGGLDSWMLWGTTEHCRPIEEVMQESDDPDIAEVNRVRNAVSAGIFDDVDDPGPPPEPVEKMRDELGKKKLPPVDRKAKVEETRNAIADDLFQDLDDHPPETMDELAKKPEPKDPPEWARKPEEKDEPEEADDNDIWQKTPGFVIDATKDDEDEEDMGDDLWPDEDDIM